MQRILITDAVTLGDATYDEVEVVNRAGIGRDELLDVVADFDAIITRSRTQVDAALIDAAPRLRAIGRGGVGVDNIDLEAASRRGIVVLNAPEANNVSAAELAVALMLAAARGVARSDRLIRGGTWDRKFLGREIKGGRLGIVGLGRIGSLVARRALGLGMEVMAYDPYINRRRAEELRVTLYDDLGSMLDQSDFLTVHTPLTDETEGMIGADELARLPAGAVVVNAARGGIVVEEALADALDRGHVFGAGIDVFTLEPPTPDHPLLQRDNVVLTAHLGANTSEAQVRVGADILDRTVSALQGDFSRGVVNAPALAPGVMEALGDHLKLGEALGTMVAQLAQGRVYQLDVEFAGSFAADPDPIAIAVTKGFLEPVLGDPPNYVNAAAIARDRDIRVSKTHASRSRGYTSHVQVTARSDEGDTSAAGTVLGASPRIVELDGFPIEIRPEGVQLICTNFDRPGAIGRVGTVLGEAGVNIRAMQLGRLDNGENEGLAMFALALEETPPDSVLEVLQNMPDVIQSLRVVRF